MKLCVLHPEGGFPLQSFADSSAAPESTPPGWKALAAAAGGYACSRVKDVPADARHVLVILDHPLKKGRQCAIDLRRAGQNVLLAFRQHSLQSVTGLLHRRGAMELFIDLCGRAHRAIVLNPDLEMVFKAGGLHSAEYLPFPVPAESEDWNFSIRPEQRTGIFLGTWDWENPTRRHFAALLLLREVASLMYEPVTVFNLHGWRGRKWLRQMGYPQGLLQVVERRLPYPEYLRTVARHKMVVHLDASPHDQQHALDALLCGLPCAGGSGFLDRALFPELLGEGRTSPYLVQQICQVLDHGHEREAALERAVAHARAQLSYEAVRQALEPILKSLE